jgi:hypothetical protein
MGLIGLEADAMLTQIYEVSSLYEARSISSMGVGSYALIL